MLDSGARRLRLGAPLARISVSRIFLAQSILLSLLAGDAPFVPVSIEGPIFVWQGSLNPLYRDIE